MADVVGMSAQEGGFVDFAERRAGELWRLSSYVFRELDGLGRAACKLRLGLREAASRRSGGG